MELVSDGVLIIVTIFPITARGAHDLRGIVIALWVYDLYT